MRMKLRRVAHSLLMKKTKSKKQVWKLLQMMMMMSGQKNAQKSVQKNKKRMTKHGPDRRV